MKCKVMGLLMLSLSSLALNSGCATQVSKTEPHGAIRVYPSDSWGDDYPLHTVDGKIVFFTNDMRLTPGIHVLGTTRGDLTVNVIEGERMIIGFGYFKDGDKWDVFIRREPLEYYSRMKDSIQ